MANIILPITNWTIKPNARYTPDQNDFKEEIYGMTKVGCHMGSLVIASDLATFQREQTLDMSLNGLQLLGKALYTLDSVAPFSQSYLLTILDPSALDGIASVSYRLE